MESKSAKYGLLGAIIAALITAGAAIYIHFDGRKVNPSSTSGTQKKTSTTSLKLVEINMPEINTDSSSSFYAMIKNSSNEPASELSFKLNFGSTTVESCETAPINVLNPNSSYANSFVLFEYPELAESEVLHIYCLISEPVFESFFISGKNLLSNFEYSYQDYINKRHNFDFFYVFKIAATGVALLFIAYVTLVLLNFINNKLKKHGNHINW